MPSEDRERKSSSTSSSSSSSSSSSGSVSLADVDVVKKGCLYIKRPPTNLKIRLKAWQKRYLVLHDDSYDNGRRLDIYGSDSPKSPNDIISTDLSRVTHVEEYNASKNFPHAFSVTIKGQAPLVLGTESEAEKQEWLTAIKLLTGKTSKRNRRGGALNNNVEAFMNRACPMMGRRSLPVISIGEPVSLVKGFPVLVQGTPSAQRNNLEGEYHMHVIGTDVALLKTQLDLEVAKWSVLNIRKFKSEQMPSSMGGDLVTLEASIHCGRLEGTYLFKTNYGKDLIQKVREAAKRINVKRPCATPESHLAGHPAHAQILERSGSAPCLRGSPPRSSPDKMSSNQGNLDTDQDNSSGGHSYLQLLPETTAPPDKPGNPSSQRNLEKDPVPYCHPYLEVLPDEDTPSKQRWEVSPPTQTSSLKNHSYLEIHCEEDSAFESSAFEPCGTSPTETSMSQTVRTSPPPCVPESGKPVCFRKDSGFCENLEDSRGSSCGTPPPPIPRRHDDNCSEAPPVPPRPPTSLPLHSHTSSQPLLEDVPPVPPPRPRHTLTPRSSPMALVNRPLPALPAEC